MQTSESFVGEVSHDSHKILSFISILMIKMVIVIKGDVLVSLLLFFPPFAFIRIYVVFF